MLLDEIAAWVEATGVGTRPSVGAPAPGGAALWIGRMPDAPADCLALIETTGEQGQDTTEGPLIEYPRLAVWSRSTDYVTARTRSDRLYRDALRMWNQTLHDAAGLPVTYLRLTPLQPPFLMARDEKDRPVIAFNVRVHRVPT